MCISCMPAATKLFSWSIELLAFASRQFAPKIVDMSVRFIRILRLRSEAPRAAYFFNIMLVMPGRAYGSRALL